MRAAPLAAQAWRRSSLTRPPCTPAHTAVLPYVDNAARSCQRHIHPPLPDQPRPPCTPPPWLMHPQPPPTLPAARLPARLPACTGTRRWWRRCCSSATARTSRSGAPSWCCCRAWRPSRPSALRPSTSAARSPTSSPCSSTSPRGAGPRCLRRAEGSWTHAIHWGHQVPTHLPSLLPSLPPPPPLPPAPLPPTRPTHQALQHPAMQGRRVLRHCQDGVRTSSNKGS